ncbi:MAG: DUF1841 family protein [Burkholderiaceae bacterium]|jgi:hypothetical protein
MFNPNRDQVRLFFVDAWHKFNTVQALTPAEKIVVQWVIEHPEYHAVLQDKDTALLKDYPPEQGETNPFLHLSMHLSLEEQLSIDQPPGIRAIYETLIGQYGDKHRAAHAVFDCLAEQLWQKQRNGQAFDNQRYLDCLKSKPQKKP